MLEPAGPPSPQTSATTDSPGSVETNSLTGAPPESAGECALGGSAGRSSTLTRISRPAEVSTPTKPLAVAAAAETITSWEALGPCPAIARPGASGPAAEV